MPASALSQVSEALYKDLQLQPQQATASSRFDAFPGIADHTIPS